MIQEYLQLKSTTNQTSYPLTLVVDSGAGKKGCSNDVVLPTMLEIGGESGVVSLFLAKLHTKGIAYITDENHTLMATTLREKITLNGLDPGHNESAHLRHLLWNHDEVPQNDVILAADVIYDVSTLQTSVYALPISS